ncbi:hypothetical protein [Chryseolinea lacunae]|uniref:SnoaL-like domain-containing protein n=1 Tax=Chryseolinea lacunae TaxID=2801331 RepID=A0ABS1KLW6_9BACT|nr:hypothetical protein [Chryseolinea lacunae]MBL0739672.1 hypothetical protein [Chryseolinea lacunae]
MKNIIVFAGFGLALFSLVGFGMLSSDRSGDIDASEADAIQRMIVQETAAYFNRDSTALFSFYADDDITQSTWNNAEGSYGTYKGLINIRKNFSAYFRKNPIPQPQPNIERSQWQFRKLSSDWMWVNFLQKTDGPKGERYTNYETRLLRNVNNQWKIVVMYSLGDHGHPHP